jgi:hypothetical protein
VPGRILLYFLISSFSILSVQKVVVPTLTSRSAEIGLSMVGAKQYWDTRFILVPAVGRTRPAGVRSWHCIARHRSARRGGYKQGGRGGAASRSLRVN